MKIVFFGDSITDMQRNRDTSMDGWPTALGMGFVFVASSVLQSTSSDYQIFNRGIAGNRSVDLLARINEVIELQPDVINVLIGVNDVWHALNNNGVDIATYEKTYQQMLDIFHEKLPNAKIMLCEPFILHGGVTDKNYEWFLQVYDYAKVVKKLATENNCAFVPLQQALSNRAQKVNPYYLLIDGVHPNAGGANVIAQEWLQAFEKLTQSL